MDLEEELILRHSFESSKGSDLEIKGQGRVYPGPSLPIACSWGSLIILGDSNP